MTWHPLLLSFRVAAIATLCAGVIGILVARALSRRFRGADVVDVLITAPMVLPPTVLGYYVLVALGARSPVGQAFEALTGRSIVFTELGAIVAATLGALPFVVKAARAAMEDVDPRLTAAAATLGAPPWRVFVTIVLPLAARGILAGLTLGFARALGDFGVTLMVAGNIPGVTQTAALAIYDAVQVGETPAGMIAVLTAGAIFALYAVNKLAARRG